VPRYTSYPTAAQFHEGVGAAEQAQALAAIPVGAPVSLYLHVPFCRSICAYCGCTTKATRRDEPVLAYADLLAREDGMRQRKRQRAADSGRSIPVVAIVGYTNAGKSLLIRLPLSASDDL
jgi:coproporphyrinogen III oxidase-like Fe-S oxidoreductase